MAVGHHLCVVFKACFFLLGHRITKNFARYLKWRVSERTLCKAILGVGEIPYISRIHTAYIGVLYLHFRYLKCLVTEPSFLGRVYLYIYIYVCVYTWLSTSFFCGCLMFLCGWHGWGFVEDLKNSTDFGNDELSHAKKPSYFPLYWLVNRDPYNGLS